MAPDAVFWARSSLETEQKEVVVRLPLWKWRRKRTVVVTEQTLPFCHEVALHLLPKHAILKHLDPFFYLVTENNKNIYSIYKEKEKEKKLKKKKKKE
jgi:hypothetical protein